MNSKASYARLYLVNEDKTKITYELTDQLTKIGRNEKMCDICVDLPGIDMIHFLIEYDKYYKTRISWAQCAPSF